jgi:hypothetical protein
MNKLCDSSSVSDHYPLAYKVKNKKIDIKCCIFHFEGQRIEVGAGARTEPHHWCWSGIKNDAAPFQAMTLTVLWRK